MRAPICCGWFRGLTKKRHTLRRLDLIAAVGAAECSCLECGGDGDWTKFMPDEDNWLPRSIPCVDCKGTGRVFIGA